jgi:SWIM zinc finger
MAPVSFVRMRAPETLGFDDILASVPSRSALFNAGVVVDIFARFRIRYGAKSVCIHLPHLRTCGKKASHILQQHHHGMELPSLTQILNRLLKDLEGADLRNADDTADSNTLPTISTLPPKVQSSLLALSQLFPQLLLSALDLLDNSLATRYTTTSPEAPLNEELFDTFIPPSIYYVRSAQTGTSRYTQSNPRAVYEVRPSAWHCTCPSFAFSAFSTRSGFDPYTVMDDTAGKEKQGDQESRWGGEMRGSAPVCKHLLAVVVGERLGVIPERRVERDILASYAYGPA